MRAYSKKQLRILKVMIRGLEAEARRIRKEEILQLQGKKRDYAFQDKKEITSWIRVYQLTYGFMRGKKYEEIESKMTLKRKPDNYNPLREQMFDMIYVTCAHFAPSQFRWHGHSDFTKEKFFDWLDGSPNTIFIKRSYKTRIRTRSIIGKLVLPPGFEKHTKTYENKNDEQ